ncbi:MAG TPA: hypothetical protein VJJ52_07015 [Candidatus Nanoarchaeia archaeon]|nr:hypothetical protein [Candidatus Nanoarchaeia archaeon]
MPRLINDALNFGVEQDNLSSLLVADRRTGEHKTLQSDHPFSASQHLFDGFHDLEGVYHLPIELYQSMNTSEIAALFIGDSVMKRFSEKRFHNGKPYSQLRQEGNVEDIVSSMVGVGYSYPAVRRIIGKGFSKHNTGPGDLKIRIALIRELLKRELLGALIGSRAVPSREIATKYDYFDSNFVGHKFGYHRQASAKVYADAFRRGMESVYRKYSKR